HPVATRARGRARGHAGSAVAGRPCRAPPLPRRRRPETVHPGREGAGGAAGYAARTRSHAAPTRRGRSTPLRLTIPSGPRTVLPDERVAGLPTLRRAVGRPLRIGGPGVVSPTRR